MTVEHQLGPVSALLPSLFSPMEGMGVATAGLEEVEMVVLSR
jgi:hypothetical protein